MGFQTCHAFPDLLQPEQEHPGDWSEQCSFIQSTFTQSACTPSTLEHQLHLKALKNTILVLRQISWRSIQNLHWLERKIWVTWPMLQASKGPHTGSLKMLSCPRIWPQVQLTHCYIFLQWVMNQKWQGYSLENQGGRVLVQGKPANYNKDDHAHCVHWPQSPVLHNLSRVILGPTLLRLSQLQISGKDTPISRKTSWNLLYVKSDMFSQTKFAFLNHFPF